MKAIAYKRYGDPQEVLELAEVEKPDPKDNEVLVKVFATCVNFNDSAFVRGKPLVSRIWTGYFNPKRINLGTDVAGQVEAIGKNVSLFQPGDEVFAEIGDGYGGYAEYVVVLEKMLVSKPTNLSYEQAAAVPQAAITALQGLRDIVEIQPEDKVLINGASGGIGSFAVQIAKYFGAQVTGVCSTKNLDFVRSLGADDVIDYKKEDFTRGEKRYDVILDIAAKRPTLECMRALTPSGCYIAVAFKADLIFRGSMKPKGEGKKARSLMAKANPDDLVFMKELLESGKVKPFIDQIFPLSKAGEAIRHYEKGAQGKVVLTIGHDS